MDRPGDNKIFTAKPEDLKDLLGDIHRHKIALPNFQRAWVWEPEMVRELLISVAYRYPAGSLLTMQVTTQTFALRAFEGAGELGKDEHPFYMVLDGQQRLTSLYQALYRPDGVIVKGRTYHFYLDLSVLLAESTGDIEGDHSFAQALFYLKEEKPDKSGKAGKRVRYDGLEPRYELNTEEQELSAGCLPLNRLFDANGALAAWKESYLSKLSGNDLPRYKEFGKSWDRLVQPWLDAIRSYPFPVVDLRSDMPLGAICHIFEKVNSTGVPLDVFDLCTAILWAKGFRLNEKWGETRQELERANILSMQPKPLAGTPFLQAISLLDSIERKRQAKLGERIAVACRKEDLMKMSVETVQKWWDVVVEAYREASMFMANQGILDARILPYTTLLIPLSAFFADVKHRKGAAHVGETWPKVAQWYWCSVFNQRYSSQVESVAAKDFEQLLAWVEGGEPPDVVRTFGFRSDDLQEITSIRNAIYKGILCLLARDGAKDFGGGTKLSVALFYNSRQDHHHIFPRDALKQMGITDPRAETIINKTLISSSVNQSIGNKRPMQYVQALTNKLGAASIDEILLSHRINPDLLRQDDWEAFVRDRRERLRDLIISACGGHVQPFYENDPHGLAVLATDDEESVA